MTQTIVNLGTGGPALNGQNGSTSGADSNDALFLDWTGLDYVYLPGVTGNYLSVPDEAALDITGDIDIRAYINADDYSAGGGGGQGLVSKRRTVGQYSYDLRTNSAGGLTLFFSTTGSDTLTRTSTAPIVVDDGSPVWVRVTVDVDNGASGHDVAFYQSSDGSSWTQIGSMVTTAGTISIFAGTDSLLIGTPTTNAAMFAGKFYRAQVFNGIDGTKVLDVDTSVLTTGAATSFTALTGQTVTINRSATGKKSVAVCQPTWLFGTNSFMEVANNDLLNFDADEAFSVVYVYRVWATPGSFTSLFNKRTTISDSFLADRIGYGARMLGTSQQFFQTNSETHYATATRASLSAGFRVGVMRYNDKAMKHLLSGTETTGTLLGGTTLRNALPFRIGAHSAVTPGEFGEFELYALALFRRELTDVERDDMVTYWTNRIK